MQNKVLRYQKISLRCLINATSRFIKLHDLSHIQQLTKSLSFNRSLNSLQHLHSIKVGTTVQCKHYTNGDFLAYWSLDQVSSSSLLFLISSKAASRGALCKKVFSEISQSSQENTCARVFFLIKLLVSGLQLY